MENLIYSKKKAWFEEELSNVPENAIAFIGDTKEIYAQGEYFGGNPEANVGAVDIEESADEISTTYLTTSPLVLTDTEKALIKENIGIEDIPQYAGGTKVTLNGTSYGEKEASFYAPTSAGTKGYFLMSSGSGSPSWTNIGYHEYDIEMANTSNLTTLTRRYFKYITLTDVVLTHKKLYDIDGTRGSLTKIINMDSVEHSITIVKEDGTALTIVNHTSLKPKKQYLISIMCDIAIMIEIGDETRLLNKFNYSQSGSTVTVTAEHAVASDVTVLVNTANIPYYTYANVSSGNTTGTASVSGGVTGYIKGVRPKYDDSYYYYY